MSYCTVQEAVKRIRSTKSDSPVVVMMTKKPGKLDVFYYKTVYGHDVVETKHPDVVGVFHAGTPPHKLETLLQNAVK